MLRSKGPVTEGMLHKPTYEELMRVAKRQQMTTYSDIAPLAGLDMDSPAHREEM